MIIGDKKKMATILISRMHPDGRESQAQVKNEEQTPGGDPVLHSISQDLLMAFKNDSAHDVMMALQAFWNEIQSRDEEQDEEESQGG